MRECNRSESGDMLLATDGRPTVNATTRGIVVLFVVAGLAFYLVAASTVGPGEVVRAIALVTPGLWAAVLALSLVNYTLRFWRWAVYLEGLSHRVPVGPHLAIYVAGFALTPTPSKVGEALRAFYLKRFGVGYGRCLAVLYSERVLDMIVVSLLASLMILAPLGMVRWLGLIGLAVAAVLVGMQLPAIHGLITRITARLPEGRLRHLGGHLAAFQSDLSALLTLRLFTLGTALGLAAWIAEGVGLWLIAQALGLEISPWAAVAIYCAAMLAGALSFIPGGLGSTEVVMISLLVSAGAATPSAVAATALIRLATLWFAIALGAGAWLGLETFRGRLMPAPEPQSNSDKG